jgi:DNA-binding GntR family transcriptional regulator
MSEVMLAPVQRLAGAPAGAQVYEVLRDAIIAAELEPGRRLSENELATQLAVSRTPVREAVARLRDDRLIEIVPQLGTFVTRISVAAVNDAQFVRDALECAAVRLAAVRAQPADVTALRDLLDRQREVCDAGDGVRFLALDDELHCALCELSGHGIAWAIAQRANSHLNRVRRLSVPQPQYLAEMVAEHGAVVDAVAAADPEAAEAALRHHLRMVLSGLAAIRGEHPDYFQEN